jgi:hypothetical protein
VFGFLYLALSRGAKEPEEDESKRGMITLYQDKRTKAA